MTTSLDLVTSALQLLGVYSPGETLASQDSTVGFTVLNNMLDSWSNESLTCYAYTQQTTTLVVNQTQYTIGTSGGANIVLTRPIKILDGPGMAYLLDSNSNKYPMRVIPQDQWNEIATGTITSNYPDTLFYDPQMPLGIINVFPTPNMSVAMYWYSYLQFTDPAALSSTVTLPPGYELAIKTNLAVWLRPYFTKGVLDPEVKEQARESKGNIKRSNIRPNYAEFEQEIVARASATYNIFTDGFPGTR
jgi:hypothetical protein